MDAEHQAGSNGSQVASKGKGRVHEDICVICLDSISERAIAVPCNHADFDFICLVSWLQDHPQCPLCTFGRNAVQVLQKLTSSTGKASLTAVEYDWRSPDDYKTFFVPSLISPTHNTGQTLPSPSRARSFRQRARGYCGRGTARTQTAGVSGPEALSKRRQVYRRQLYSLHVGSNSRSRFRDFTPESFAKSPQLESRARMWIRRELQVFDFLSTEPDAASTRTTPGSTSRIGSRRKVENAEFLLSYIVSILATIDIKSSSGAAQRLLADFLGEENAALFLHELNHWLRSPYTQLDNWDRNVQYAEKLPAYESNGNEHSRHVQHIPWGGFRHERGSGTSVTRRDPC